MKMVEPKILLVEDTVALAETYRAYLAAEGVPVEIAETGEKALAIISRTLPDVIVLDVNLPDSNGIDLLRQIRAEDMPTEVVVITGQASVALAVEAMREGAFDFIMKPFTADRLRVTVRNALKHRLLARRVETIDDEFDRDSFQGMVGRSFAMQTVYRVLQNAAPTNATIFVTGESGTGKELCARAVHDLSRRVDGPFVSINCAAIPRDLLESEIFGHARGAFTGATSERKGAALTANGGTLFLDEICEMDLALQSKLLRFLQDKAVRRVGEDMARLADVRIVCATNCNPLEAIAEGRFRQDLYYRLHVVPVELPPLRERDDDVLLIARHLLADYSREDGKKFRAISSEAEQALLSFGWPGNIRQLQNSIRTAVVLHDGETLELDMLPAEIRAAPVKVPGTSETLRHSTARDVFVDPSPAVRPLETVIRETIEQAIAKFGGSIPKAAAALQVSPSTIYRRLQAWEEAD
ncbi:sigma-54-dependent Fis family transcriptional regulator [Stappia sp. F7233]|uniref:Sigma-54-dependent Fis family transcriptional regulator n=1 Tax=Stappia albiluteola TaxID=2758565 RepID=A0A839AKY0_9HYPH|nr:sigma-54 dependent transcriptional regulator [Stappia albiluteola]MBA5779109.1 sigma-54-dependent Fis family transcriptional regulator [Stappia albiluteola]